MALAAIEIAAPIVLERRYRLLVDALVRLHRSRRGRWSVAAGSGLTMAVLALLAVRHFATSPWPLSGGQPGVLVAVCLLLLLAQGFKAWGWGRLFASDERPRALALAAGNGGAALIGVVLPGRFDDAMRVAVVRRYPGCRAGVRAGLTVVAVAGVAAAGLLLVLPRFAGSKRALRFRLGRWVSPRTTSRRRLSEAWALVSACWRERSRSDAKYSGCRRVASPQ